LLSDQLAGAGPDFEREDGVAGAPDLACSGRIPTGSARDPHEGSQDAQIRSLSLRGPHHSARRAIMTQADALEREGETEGAPARSGVALVMPMAGRGSRFVRAGRAEPKPLIDVAGRPAFWWAAESVRRAV